MYKRKCYIHFVGIGGIGMSGIAHILKLQGHRISGCDCDLDQQSITQLRSIGCEIWDQDGSRACQDKSIDILVYSSAIRPDFKEIKIAQERGIPTIPRALMLAELMRTKYSVAIAGSHGKTTTTSMISHLLIEANMDPTVVIGGHLKNISANARFGNGDFLVAEADESDRSLLNLHATIAIVTNVDLEHLETYTGMNDIKQTFVQFLNNLPFYGKAIVCIDDPNIRSLFPLPHIKTIKYGTMRGADILASNIEIHSNESSFDVSTKNNGTLGRLTINMLGRHNVLNALAATALAIDVGLSFKQIKAAFQTFKGIDRRFSYHGKYKAAELFDDYGHHPREIANTLRVARLRAGKDKLNVMFQPHRYTRTQKLWEAFVDVFASGGIDNLVLTDIYPASETPIEGVTGEKLADAIKTKAPWVSVTYVPFDSSFSQIIERLEILTDEESLLLLLGAGKLNLIPAKLKALGLQIQNKSGQTSRLHSSS